VALSAFAGLLFLELYLRIAPLRTIHGAVEAVSIADVDLAWTSPAYDRIEPIPRDGAEVRKRMLVLGDSYMTASPRYVVDGEDALWPVHLRRLLPPKLRNRLATCVLAAPGWGLNQQLIAYEQKGSSTQPDLVVVCICSNNDLLDITTATDANRASRPYFELEGEHLIGFDTDGRPIDLGHGRVVGRSRIAGTTGFALLDTLRVVGGERGWVDKPTFNGIHPRYTKYSGNPTVASLKALEFPRSLDYSPQHEHDLLNAYIVEPTAWTRYQWSLMERLLEYTRDRVRADGAELAVLVLPMTLDTSRPDRLTGSGFVHEFETPDGRITVDLAHPNRQFKGICERLGILHWDVIDDFHARLLATDRFEEAFPDSNRHWTGVGHHVVAEVLADEVGDWLLAESRTPRR
jgi:hypothetical protein